MIIEFREEKSIMQEVRITGVCLSRFDRVA